MEPGKMPHCYKLIACEILFRELSYCAARSCNKIDITFLPKGLHDMGEKKMTSRLQEVINQVEPSKYEAILLGYGLCSNGIRGLRAPLPMVIIRAHDCITLLLGSKEKYKTYFEENPGTYYKSPGWVERDGDPNGNQDSITTQLGMNHTYQEYVDKYGEDNARYLMEILGDGMKNYSKMAYIDTHVMPDQEYQEQTRDEAAGRGWEYETLNGDIGLLQRLLDGDWDVKDFLTIPPPHTIAPTHDDAIIGLA
jgi:hypothetical protein